MVTNSDVISVLTVAVELSWFVVAYFINVESKVTMSLRRSTETKRKGQCFMCLRLGDDTDFLNKKGAKVFAGYEIIHQRTVPCSPQMNRTIIAKVPRMSMARTSTTPYGLGLDKLGLKLSKMQLPAMTANIKSVVKSLNISDRIFAVHHNLYAR